MLIFAIKINKTCRYIDKIIQNCYTAIVRLKCTQRSLVMTDPENILSFVLPTVVTVAVACLVYWGIDRKNQNKHR